MRGEGAGPLTCRLDFRPVAHAAIAEETTVGPEWVVSHNTYRNGKGGYDWVARVTVRGGEVKADGRTIGVTGADEALVLLRIVPWKIPVPASAGEAWAYSPENPDFSAARVGRYEPAPPLAESSVVPTGPRATPRV